MRPLLLVLLVACSSSKADAPKAVAPPAVAPAPVNVICQEFKTINPKVPCAPLYTDVGETHLHSALVTLGEGQQFRCSYSTQLLSIECRDSIVIRREPTPAVVDEKPKAAFANGKPVKVTAKK